jgi:hypothetical protein
MSREALGRNWTYCLLEDGRRMVVFSDNTDEDRTMNLFPVECLADYDADFLSAPTVSCSEVLRVSEDPEIAYCHPRVPQPIYTPKGWEAVIINRDGFCPRCKRPVTLHKSITGSCSLNFARCEPCDLEGPADTNVVNVLMGLEPAVRWNHPR